MCSDLKRTPRPMRILVLYATTEGHTQKIARVTADRLTDAGHSVEIIAAADGHDLALGRFDGAILAASVHMSGFQGVFVEFARQSASVLNGMPTLFLSVSLSAAGDDVDDWAGITRCVLKLTETTEWRPGRIAHIAGAFKFTEYDFFKRWAMRRIAREKGIKVDNSEDLEMTDWDQLANEVNDWLTTIAPTH